MTEDSLSLNIVREPFRKRRAKATPETPAQNLSKVQDTGQPTFNFSKKSEKQNRKQKTSTNNEKPRKQSIWKAVKGAKTADLNRPAADVRRAAKTFTGKSRPSEWKTTRLFANNPEVPEVLHQAVKPIKEPVFSSKGFKELELHPFMIKTLEETLDLSRVTAVQEKLIPVLLSGRDALVRSQTGSGKTLAFAVPIVHNLQTVRPKLTRADGVRALIVAPSRELALQIHEAFVHLTKSFTWLVPGILMGGERRKAEKARLRKGINILTCTPGRLLDHINKTDCLNLAGVQYFVLDEADRMLDMGYEQDVAQILEKLAAVTQSRQTVLLSATLTPGVERLAGLSLRQPERVDVVDAVPASVPVHHQDVVQDALVLPDALAHTYVVTPAKLRLVTLAAFIMDKCLLTDNKVIVFMATQDMVDLHATILTSAVEMFSGGRELQLTKLHGSMAQQERTKVFLEFRKAETALLLCTDVAARGLDLPEVDWVVQYNGPASISDYVHRVGRTARRGLAGSAVLFLATNETEFISRLETARVRLSETKLEDVLQRLCVVNGQYRSHQEAATRLQAIMESIVEEEKPVHDAACKAYTSWVRFYASYPRSLKECFSVKKTHLGHFAKSFALREPPTAATRHAKSIAVTAHPNRDDKKRPRTGSREEKGPKMVLKRTQRPQKRTQFSEFDSGLEPIKKKKKAK